MAQEDKGIIFDMDGVLVDSEQFYYERRKAFLNEYQLNIETLPLSVFVGGDMRSLWKTILRVNETSYDEEFLKERYQQYKSDHPIDYQPLIMPDAKKVLQFLKRKNYRTGIASSSGMEDIQTVLQEGKLESYFDVVVSGVQFKKSKPNPEIYQYTVKELGLQPNQCLAIEDSEKGIRSAHDAGLTVWALKDVQFNMNQQLADGQLSSLTDICKKIENKDK